MPSRHRQTRRPFRLRLESLEDRLALTPFTGPPVFTSDPVTHVLTATLTEAQGAANIGGTSVINAWTYNGLYNGTNYTGLYPGPTLWAQPGDTLDLTIVNQLPGVPTNLHTHGLHVSPLGNSDNVLLLIEAGEDNHYRIQIPADHPEGLYWYHPHHHGFVNSQISMGLSGLLVIGQPDGGATQLDGLPQQLIGLQNALLAGNQINVPLEGSDVGAQTFTVNGLHQPDLEIPVGEWQVFNVANIGNNAFYLLQVADITDPLNPTTVPLYLVAADGNPLTNVRQPGFPAVGMPPGRRWSFTFPPKIDALGNAVPGKYALVTIGFNDGTNQWPPPPSADIMLPSNTPAMTLMTMTYTGTPIPAPPAPVTNNMPLTPPNQNYHDLRLVPADQIAARRTVVFGGRDGFSLINDQPFPNNPVFQPRLGTVEEWTLINPTVNDHPFHLHVNPQQVVAAQNQPNGLAQWQDVINVPHATTTNGVTTPGQVTIRIEFQDYLGELVFHCHRVDHEDMGMMAPVNIIPSAPYYAVGANANARPVVKVFNSATDKQVASFLAFGENFRGGVNVAAGDVNGDGVYDVIVAPARGPGRIKVIDGTKLDLVNPDTGVIRSSALLGDFYAFNPGFANGVFVAAGDTNSDGLADVILGAGRGAGPVVRVVNATKLNQVRTDGAIVRGALLAEFDAYSSTFRGGVRVAAGDIDGDGRTEIVTGAGPGGPPRVKVFGGEHQEVLANFLAFEQGFTGGVFVGTGNIKGYAFNDIIVGKGAGSTPLVSVFSCMCMTGMDPDTHEGRIDLEQTDAFFAYARNYTGGVQVSSLHDIAVLGTYGGSRDDVVTTLAHGNGLNPKVFARTIPVM